MEVERKNLEIEQARRSLEDKAEQLALTSKYKSEFMANMSHELRTPLNSLLILAQQLADNEDSNLTEKQVEFARIIKSSGEDLLSLISDILDLTKIESGTVILDMRKERFEDIREFVERTFDHVAESRHLNFGIRFDPKVPNTITTDSKRLQQVLANLLSNAFKFTERGSVTLLIEPAGDGWSRDNKSLNASGSVIAFRVIDTGIGIPRDKQKVIFEPFAQGDGSGHPTPVADDRDAISEEDRCVLIIEDDPKFAKILLDLTHQSDLKGVIAMEGEQALLLARQFRPIAVTLDLGLHDMSGWAVLDRLKLDAETADIPVHVVSIFDDQAEVDLAKQKGAATYTTKPIGREALQGLFARIEAFIDTGGESLLIIEDDPIQRQHIVDTLGLKNVHTFSVGSGKEAIEVLKAEKIDCVVLDLGLPDVDGHKLIDSIKKLPGRRDTPIIVYTAAELSVNAEARLRKQTKAIITKSGAAAEHKLLEDVSQFFARVAGAQEKPPPAVTVGTLEPTAPDPSLEEKKALIVDDDVRNIFALTALLERHGMQALHTESGKEAIQLVRETPSLDVVLMDIMMPEMDGLEAIAAIRKLPGFESLPIIALTAKAMKGDRESCLEAGASDYIAKPVDPEQLLTMLRVWLSR